MISNTNALPAPEVTPALPAWWSFAAGAWLQAAAALLWLPQAGLIAIAIHRLANGAGIRDILPLAAALLAVGVLRSAGDALGMRWSFIHARNEVSRARLAAVAALSNRSPLDKERPASGLAASTVAEQAEALLPYLARYLPARRKAVIVPLAILFAVGWFSWIAAIILLAAAPLIPLFAALVGWRAKAASESHMVELGSMHAYLLDRLRGLATIRGLGAVDATANRLRQRADDLRIRIMAVLKIAFLSSAALELFAALGVALVAIYVGFHLLGQLNFGTWHGRLSLGEALFVLLLAPSFFEPLRELASVWHDRAAGEAARSGLARLSVPGLPLPGSSLASDSRSDKRGGAPSVVLSGIRFSHAGTGATAVEQYNLNVHAGEHVALVGPSGTGKSTLLALIAGLAEVEDGSIVIGDIPLMPATAARLRARMAWVGQRPHVFSGSLRTNVLLGRDICGERYEQALHSAALDEVAARRPDADLAEGGAGLSGGEALRLAIARAAVAGSFDLVLADEPTAHLDSYTADDVTNRLLALAQGKTMIVATHDPKLAARMDRIVMLSHASATGAAQ